MAKSGFFKFTAVLAISGGILSSGCGVKGPPLPPVADTPEASDRPEVSGATSTPAPSPSPTPRAKTKRGR